MFPNNLLKGTRTRLMSAAQCLCRAESRLPDHEVMFPVI